MYLPRLGKAMLLVLLGACAVWGYKSLQSTPVVMGCTPGTTAGVYDPEASLAYWNNEQVSLPNEVATAAVNNKVLGATSDQKWIEVNLTSQTLTAHDGDQIFLTSLISSGLWNKTPVGEYRIWYKIKYTLMTGGEKENNTYYYLPNVPFTMFFYKDYGIHGTYWHHNFGHPMSHGCVNAPTPVAEQLFYWTDPQLPAGKSWVRSTPDNPGTRVVVHN